MKRGLFMTFGIFALAVGAMAGDLNVADLLVDAPKYVGKTVAATGTFLYSEPMRESFTIAHDGVRLEVFYRDLPPGDKMFVLSLARNSKTPINVSGMLKQYANKERSYFMEALNLHREGSAAAPASASQNTVTYLEIAADPAKYVNKPVTMTGAFFFSEPMRQSFTFEQGGKTVEVLLSDLSKIDRDRILELKKNSKVNVIVTGLLQKYANDAKRFYIAAYSVSLEN